MTLPKRGFLQRVFHIYPDERRNVFLFALLGFLWAFAATCGQKFADALFLLHIGAESLPKAYTMEACGMFVIAALLIYAYHRLSCHQIFLTVLSSAGLFYFALLLSRFLGFETHAEWFWYGLKLNGFFLFVVLTTCYWTFIDQYHHMQDSKRLYSLFSSMVFLGAGSTGIVMQSGLLSFNAWMMSVIFLICLTGVAVIYITKRIPLITHEEESVPGETEAKTNSFRYLIRSILASKFTLLVMACNFTLYLLLVITEYNYMFTFENHFAPVIDTATTQGTESTLTLFLGRCLATVSVSNLIFGLFIYSRLVRRVGVSSMLVITPILLIIAFSGWSFSTSLLFPLIGFFVVEGTLQVIDDSNFSLLLNAVPPKLKYKIRAMIESLFEPIGMLVSATLISLFQENSRWVGLGLAAVSLIIAFAIRKRYLGAIFHNLSDNAIHFRRSVKDWLRKIPLKDSKKAHQRFSNLLLTGHEETMLFAAEGLLGWEDESTLESILNRFEGASLEGKNKLVQLIKKSSFSENNRVAKRLSDWDEKEQKPVYIPQLKSDLIKERVTLDRIQGLITSSRRLLPSQRRLVESSIAKIGNEAIPALLLLLEDPSLPYRCRLLAGRVIGRISLPCLQKSLSRIIDKEIQRAYFYFYHAHRLEAEDSQIDVSLLKELLMSDYLSVIDFIIQLLGTSDEVEDEELLSRSIKSKNPKIKSQAVEAIEKTCDPIIFRSLKPLLDDTPEEEKMRIYLKNGGVALNLNALIDKMSASPLQIDQLNAAALKYQLRLQGWREVLEKYFASQDKIFQHFAAELLN